VDTPVAADLLDLARTAKAAGLTDDGMQYGPETDNALGELARLAESLTGFVPAGQLTSRSDALAFWINLYNALVIHAAMRFGVRGSVTEIPRFFKRAAYNVGGRSYSLDLIEHGLLRENRGHPLRLGLPQLMPWDRRRDLVLCPMDVRIHFALNCGAASCPPIRHYTPERIDRDLGLAARSFVTGGGVSVDGRTGGVLLSRIFRWYARDFGWTARRQLRTALEYLNPDQQNVLAAAAVNGIRYADYDWSFA
jgi:hypothetical protein